MVWEAIEERQRTCPVFCVLFALMFVMNVWCTYVCCCEHSKVNKILVGWWAHLGEVPLHSVWDIIVHTISEIVFVAVATFDVVFSSHRPL